MNLCVCVHIESSRSIRRGWTRWEVRGKILERSGKEGTCPLRSPLWSFLGQDLIKELLFLEVYHIPTFNSSLCRLFENADNLLLFLSWINFLFTLLWIILSSCSVISFIEENIIYMWSLLGFLSLGENFIAVNEEHVWGLMIFFFLWMHENMNMKTQSWKFHGTPHRILGLFLCI